MSLSIEDRVKTFIPWYYAYKIAKVKRSNEPELGILRDLVRPGCTAIDVGANRGFYSYALAQVADRVEAFEPNPALARFARRKLGSKVHIHEVALADREGREDFTCHRTGAVSTIILAAIWASFIAHRDAPNTTCALPPSTVSASTR